MDLFVVQRSGVYDQGIAGIYSSEEKANVALNRAKDLEPDNYHGFDIIPYILDEFVELET